MRSIRRILGISWQDRVPNTEVLSRAHLTSMHTLHRQRRLRWLGHVHRKDDKRIPKDVLYGELINGRRNTGRHYLRFKDVCKRDLRALEINVETWERLADSRSLWRGTLREHLKAGEQKLINEAEDRRLRRKEHAYSESNNSVSSNICDRCYTATVTLSSVSSATKDAAADEGGMPDP